MKFKKILRTLAVTALMFVGGSAINASADAKMESPSDTVSIKLHKMLNTDSSKTITNTGNLIEDLDGIDTYKVAKYGEVTFKIFDIKNLLDGNEKTAADFTAARDDLIDDIVGGATTPEEIQAAYNSFIETYTDPTAEKKITLVGTKTLTNDETDGIMTFNGINKKGTYLILETNTAKIKEFSEISAPLIFNLPIANVSGNDVHLYTKNLFPGSETGLIKEGTDPEDLTVNKELKDVEFTLTKVGDNDFNKVYKTDVNGKITFDGLQAGEYTLTETSNSEYPWYHQMTNTAVSLKFTVAVVDGVSKITVDDEDVNTDYFTITKDGKGNVTSIHVQNNLILGNADFVKVDADSKQENNTYTKTLEGAKFKISKTTDSGTKWAQFNENDEFTGWVTNKDDYTNDEGVVVKGGTELTSDINGKFGFTGVPYAYDAKDGEVTYHAVETQAPSGYAKLAEPFPFTIGETTITKYIENERYSLPITGGMGIWLFVIAGLALMGGSGYLYYKKQRNA